MENKLNIISIRENPEYKDVAIRYFQHKWESVLPVIYQDCITHCIGAELPLPQWYLLKKGEEIIGCAGLVTNDFVSRMDLYPWLCALFVDNKYRGRQYGSLLVEKAKEDTLKAGFKSMYLTTDHINLYEKYGFEYLGQGYHPWGGESRIYRIVLEHPQVSGIHIRREEEADYRRIYNLIQRAFLSAPVKDGDEQDFAEQLRNSSNYIPELAFVAMVGDKLAGHIMLTHTTVKEPDGRIYQALLLAPLSVLLEYRKHGIGAKLIETACQEAYRLGYKVVFLCGDPAYYNRFGFRQASGFDIHPAGDRPEQYVLVRELETGALNGVSGTVTCC